MRCAPTLGVGFLLSVLMTSAANAQASAVHAHVGEVAVATEGTPGLLGLLPTAVAEAAIAAQHAEFAAAAGTNLSDMQLHAGHVIHALEPTLSFGGPGYGFGVRLAATEAATHIALAASDSSASDNVRVHAEHLAAILANVVSRTDEAISLAQRIQAASSVTAAASLLGQLVQQTETLARGRDLDRDGLIGWRGAEGGLRQATQHMTLLQRGEGLIP